MVIYFLFVMLAGGILFWTLYRLTQYQISTYLKGEIEMKDIFERLAEAEKELEQQVPVLPSEKAYTEWVAADSRVRAIMNERASVQKEAEQIYKGMAKLPLEEVDAVSARFMLLVQKTEILTDMHRIATADVERLAKEIERLKAVERSQHYAVSDEKLKRAAALRVSLDDIDNKWDKEEQKKRRAEISQLEAEAGGRVFVPR
jgi:hypothetical protein